MRRLFAYLDANENVMKELNFETEKLPKLFFSYGAVSVVSIIVFCLYSLIDSIFVARYTGEFGMAAITLSAPVLSIFCMMALTVSVGGNTLISASLGNQNFDAASRYFSLCVKALLVVSLAVTVIMTVFPETIATMLHASGELLELSAKYIRINGAFAVFFLFQGFLSNVLNAVGKPVAAMISNISTAVINICLDYILIVRFHLGISGAAVASGIATMVATAICVVPLTRSSAPMRLIRIKMQWKLLFRMIYNGLSDGLSAISSGVLAIIMNWQIVRLFSGAGLAAFGVVQAIFQFFGSILLGFTGAINPIVAYNWGAKNHLRIKETIHYFHKMTVVIALVMTVALQLCQTRLIGLFDTIQADGRLIGIIYLSYCGMMLFSGGSAISISYFTAINDPKTSAALALFRVVILRIFLALLLPDLLGGEWLWYSIPLSEFVSCVVGNVLTEKSLK